MCYEYRKLKDHERNYVVHDLELAAGVHALNMWHQYLLGKIFILLTDNTCVNHLLAGVLGKWVTQRHGSYASSHDTVQDQINAMGEKITAFYI